MNEKLDILIPHFEDISGLRLSLESVKRQTWHGELRVVIADDGSSAGCQEALDALSREASLPIKLIKHTQNRGRPFMRNVLLDAIEGTHVCWLDAGDEWYPKKLERQFRLLHEVAAASSSSQIWITCSYDWARRGRKTKRVAQDVNGDCIKNLLIGDHLRAYLWTLLGTADSFKSIGYFDENLPRLQDLDYFIRFFLHGGVMYSVDQRRSLCVYHKSDVGRNAKQVRSCSEYIFKKYEFIYRRYGPGFIKMRKYKMELLAARFAQSNGQFWLRNHYLLRAARRKPSLLFNRIVRHGLKV